MKKLLTMGYVGATILDVHELLDRENGILIDVRLKPYSRWVPEWDIKNLSFEFGPRYAWIEDFGNLNYKSGPIAIKDFASGYAKLHKIAGQKTPVLLCCCKDVNVCHRKSLAEIIRDVQASVGNSIEIEHISFTREQKKAKTIPEQRETQLELF